jgi:molybdopterin molybdotransferase
MDGYAVRHAEAQAGQTLKVGELIPAGHWPQSPLSKGEAARIFTGAPLPIGADAVVIQENCQANSDQKEIFIQQTAKLGEHIRKAGEELAVGDLVAPKGTKISPGLLGLCAAQGWGTLPVFTQAKVAIIETGTELKSPGQDLEGAEIYAMNALTLAPLIKASAAQLSSAFRTKDSVQTVVNTIQHALESDVQVILTTGGVSVGDFDPIHEALEILGAQRHFWKVKMKPGKPLSVASIQSSAGAKCLLIGLPGNPVSCVVSYLLFVHPLLQKMAGVPEEQCGLRRINCMLQHDLRKTHHRAELFRVRLNRMAQEDTGKSFYGCELTGGQSSAWMSSIAQADGLLYMPDQPCQYTAGQQVEVSLLPGVELETVKHYF